MSPKKCMIVLLALAAPLALAACTASPAMEATYAMQMNPETTTPSTASPEASFTSRPTPTSAATSSSSLQPTPTPSKKPTPTAINYEAYLGNWICSDEAKTRSEVFDLGGLAIQFVEITGNHIAGNVISVSESYGHRDARVDFDGVVDDGGVLTVSFDNDGWDNYGTITIIFQENSLFVRMQSTATDEYTNWDIGNGEYIFIRGS